MQDEIDDLEMDTDDKRNAALERAYTNAEPEFYGIKLRPITAGSMALLERTRNGILTGNVGSLIFDAAAFVILHIADEQTARAARNAVDKDWLGFVTAWLDKVPQAHAKLIEYAVEIRKARDDYDAVLTRDLESVASGNAGGHIG